jgi:hypothetical protein
VLEAAPMSGLEVDDTRWPLVEIHWPDGTVRSEDVDRFLAIADEHIARKSHYVALHDGVRASGVDAAQRKRFAAHVDRNRNGLTKWCVAAAIVASSPIVRGIVTAVNWMSPPPMPQRVFAKRDDAVAWLASELRVHGLEIPPARAAG